MKKSELKKIIREVIEELEAPQEAPETGGPEAGKELPSPVNTHMFSIAFKTSFKAPGMKEEKIHTHKIEAFPGTTPEALPHEINEWLKNFVRKSEKAGARFELVTHTLQVFSENTI